MVSLFTKQCKLVQPAGYIASEGWEWNSVCINATQSHSGEQLVILSQYVILKNVIGYIMFRNKLFSGTDPLELCSGPFSISFIIGFIFFILAPLICCTCYHLMLVIVCRMSKYVDINFSGSWVLTSCQLHDALKIFLISSYFSFHIFTL